MATAKTPTIEDLSAQIETLQTDIATLTLTITDLVRAKGEDLADAVKGEARTARASAQLQIAEAQKHVLASAESAEDYVRRNPAAALGIAAGVGVLVGLISARR